MELTEISILQSKEEIIAVMENCSDSFFDQSKSNNDSVNSMADKFYQYAVVFAAYYNQEAAGFIAFYCNDNVTFQAYLSMIVVSNKYHNLGIGSKLLNKMEQYCTKRGFKNIKLEVNKENFRAIDFYTKRGFEWCGPASSQSDYYMLGLEYNKLLN